MREETQIAHFQSHNIQNQPPAKNLMSAMPSFVAFGTEGDPVFLIATRPAPEVLVVHLKMKHTAAHLTTPAVALQHLAVQFAVSVDIQPESRILGADTFHEALAATSDKKASCWVSGRNRK